MQVYDLGVSDHKVVTLDLTFLPPLTKSKRCMCFRNQPVREDILNPSPPAFLSVDEIAEFYNQSLSSVLDLHAPIKTRDVSFAHSAPWFTPGLRNMKSIGCILERSLRNLGLTFHKLAFQEHQRAYSKALKEARLTFYSHLINKILETQSTCFPP